jgi:adenylate kinase
MDVAGNEVVLLMGPPGAGKGTQASLLADRRKLAKLSTGDMLRSHVGRGTELGKRAQRIMESGGLVSDDIIIGMVRSEIERLQPLRVLLDGFPRTRAQARELDEILAEQDAAIDAVVALQVPDDELVERLLNRAREQGRTDDNEDTIRERMKVYREETQPLLEFYDERGELRRVEGTGSVEEVFERIEAVLP